MAFRSLSSSRDRTSAFICSTSAFSKATSWFAFAFIRTEVSQAVSGEATMAIRARRISFISEIIVDYCTIPMERSHSWTSNEGQAFAATSLCPMIRTPGNRLWKDFT